MIHKTFALNPHQIKYYKRIIQKGYDIFRRRQMNKISPAFVDPRKHPRKQITEKLVERDRAEILAKKRGGNSRNPWPLYTEATCSTADTEALSSEPIMLFPCPIEQIIKAHFCA
jgi:hypothetical protein